MTKRIGLFTPALRQKTGAPSTTPSYVDIESAADLQAKLNELGATQVALLRRDRVGTTHMEGGKLKVADLTDEHVSWCSEKVPGFETRGIFYERK